LHQQLVTAFANSFIAGGNFATIITARSLAEGVLNQKIASGTPAAKLVDESVEQGLILAARQLVGQSQDPLQTWEQCLDLYDRQPALNTRTSTSILQQAYSTPVPIAFLAGKLARINREVTVYEPTAGNGALLLLADPSKAIVNELNSDRAAALRAQGFTVTQQDASKFIPATEAVDRIITNPPFGSLKDAQGQTEMFRRGRLTTSQLDHAIALSALEVLKADGKAVLILGGKMGDEQSRTERYNTQLTRGFYRWLYNDAGYKVADHFSLAGNLYRKQGTSFPIDVILIEGRGETQLKLPGVEPPRVYSSYDELKEVLIYAVRQQQSVESSRDTGITLPGIHARSSLDTNISYEYSKSTTPGLDDSISATAVESDREPRGILDTPDAASGVVDRANSRLEDDLRSIRGVGSQGLGSAGNQPVFTDVYEQHQSRAELSPDGFLPGDELSGVATKESDRTTVSRQPLSDARDRNQLSRGHESNRLADVYEYGRKSTLFSGLETMAEPTLSSEAESELVQQQDIEDRIPYKPRSQAISLFTLTPAASIKGLETAFNKLEAKAGMSVDEYVRDRLNEPNQAELFSHYAAEQIDSLALAIYNHEFENKATLVGHDTGIGKTRIICGLARYAQQQGMTPVIVTADSVLYADILVRDAVDTGNSFNPLITNNDYHLTLRSTDGRKIGEINTPQNQGERVRQYAQSGNIGEHDCIFTTYGQLTGPPSVGRRELLSAIAPRSFLILDESHKAGGAAAEKRPERQSDRVVPSCSDFFQALVTQTPGFVASSATAIKDPIIAARLFYETTDLKLAAPDQEQFTDHLKAGGVPLQQQVFAMWAESGGCIRCEKSYEGVEFDIAKVPVSLQTAENNAKILNAIWQFDKAKSTAVKEVKADYADAGEAARNNNPALGEAGAESTTFTSVLHNLTAVTSLGLKAEETANAAISDIEQGRKPILMLFNTMEGAVRDFVDTHNELADTHNAEFPDRPMQRIEVGDDIQINAGQLFTRYLEKARTIKIIEPYLNELTQKNETRAHRLTDEELGSEAVALFHRAESAIAQADWSNLPISPIDYIKQKIEDAGHSVGEITGRSHILKYESADALAFGVVTYSTRSSGTAQKKQVMDDFQNGRLDAIITNSTTGYSLHAARSVADQRQRVMYLVQPHLDVNQVEQSIGRSHRSGQLDPAKHAPDSLDEQGKPQWGQYPGTFGLPVFKLVVGQDLPTEERAVAILMRKMGHLKANTTGNRSSSFGLVEMPDFINDYGNEVAQSLMEQNTDLHAALDHPLGYGEELSHPKAIQIVTGRAVMLASSEPPTPENPYPSLAKQALLYDTLSSEYKEFLSQKIALGENELEAQKLDLQAEPSSRLILSPGDSKVDSPFTKPAYLVEVLAKTGAKPNTTEQVVNAVRQELGLKSVSNHNEYALSEVREIGKQASLDTVEELSASTKEFTEATIAVKKAEIAANQARVDKYQHKLDAATENYTSLQQQQEAAAKFGNTELFDFFKTKLEQQQPKIDKLTTQLSKAKLDVNGKQFQLAKEQRTIKATLEDVNGLLTQFPVGQPVRLMDKESKNYLYGVVAGVEQKNRANNPAAPGNWKLKLLVVDGVRSLSVKFDSLLKGGKQSLEPVETAASFLDIKQESSVYDLFDQRQTEAKEKRYLVSGQVLASSLTGKFAQVTDDKGQVHPVYLLRRGFDPAVDMNLAPVMLENSSQVKQFLFDKTERLGIAQTPDENLTVITDIRRTNHNGIILKTPKAHAQGGIYFKDEGLRELIGDFTSKTESVKEGNNTKPVSVMTVSVSADKVNEVLAYVNTKWGLGAASHKDIAREMLGEVLPSWQPCSEINPDAPRIPTSRTAPRFAMSDLQQSSVTVSTPQIDAPPGFGAASSPLGEQPLSHAVSDANGNGMLKGNRSTTSSAIASDHTFAAPTLAVASQTLEHNEPIKQIALANNQTGAAEKNAAKLLHQGGLATEILKGEDFHLKVENKPFTPLSIERHGQEMYLTHYLKDNYGDLFLDAEMVFNISNQGKLTLTQTATQNPFNGGEYRSNDRSFGQTFSSNLLAQGFAIATLSAFQEKQSQQNHENSVVSIQEVTDSIAPGGSDATQAKLNEHPSPPEQLPLATNNSKDREQPPLSKASPTALHLSEPPTVSSVNRTKQSGIKHSVTSTSKSTQVQEPQPVQLSLFDVGLNPNSVAELKSISQNPIQGVKAVALAHERVEEAEPSSQTNNSPPSTSNRPGANPTDNNLGDRLVDPMRIFQEVVDRIDRQTGEKLATIQPSSPSLETLRDWYKAARELGKPEKHLNRIAEIGNDFKQGTPLTEKAAFVMGKDLQAHFKNLAVVEQLNLLPQRDLVGLHQVVDNYLKTAPSPPPPEAERQVITGEVQQLTQSINSLGKQQKEAIAAVEAMQKSPLRNWNGKYDAAVAQVQQTATKLEQAIALQQQKANQIGQWGKQGQAYQAWNQEPRTADMKLLAQGLNSPQIRERLANAQKQSQQQSHLPAGQQRGDRGQGLSI